jgi:hypothetical protein
MIGLYLVSIVIAWLVGPKPKDQSEGTSDSRNLRLVIAATMIEQAARRHRKRGPSEFPRPALTTALRSIEEPRRWR